MIAEKMVTVNYNKDSDALYVNFEQPLSNPKDEVDTEEISLGVFRVYNENIPSVTYRYVILDYSFQDHQKLKRLVGIDLPDV